MKPILPGAIIGVLGSGQLGRMLAIEARKMGYRIYTYSPENDTPTGHIADLDVNASYQDLDAIAAFARSVDVVTFEFENVSSEAAAKAAEFAIVRPGGDVLHIAQNRLREKRFCRDQGLPTTPFLEVHSQESLEQAVQALGFPAVLKTAGWGYDGKGQHKILQLEDALPAWESMGRQSAILEAFVSFDAELSVVAARGVDGQFAHYGLLENSHLHHVLDLTVSHPNFSPKVQERAIEITRTLFDALDLVGVMCVEFFLRGEELMINEMAPRPHNSGHLTFDACVTSQFEQQLRAVCGLPLGSTAYHRPAAMVNLLGDCWSQGIPQWQRALADDRIKLHLYGKTDARPGRKMGHMTALATTRNDAWDAVLKARQLLSQAP